MTIKGIKVIYTIILPAGACWQWIIEDKDGNKYRRGDYASRQAAINGMMTAMDNMAVMFDDKNN